MKITFAATRPTDAAVLALAVRKGAEPVGITADHQSLVAGAISGQRFEGEAGTSAELFLPVGGDVQRVILLGVGAGDDAAYERAGGAIAAKLLTAGAATVVADLSGADAACATRFATGAAQRSWRFDEYRTTMPAKQKPTLEELVVVSDAVDVAAAWAKRDAVTRGLGLARTLATLPPNILYPESFVERVTAAVDGLGLEVTVLDEAQMGELGMGALLGVSQGSRREARILALKWNGGGDAPLTALVGKGVTFDTGGISIKPAAGMEDMKWDMGGAGAVAGAMLSLAARQARANVIGVMGLVENMPDGNAQRPGDVVTSMSGQTIEVINTDAEGRLVLCDAITWVQREHKPARIIDLATLTGAMIVSLGNEMGGLFSNDDALAEQILAAGRASGDMLWRFPLSDGYDKLIDSAIADMKNVGPRGGGSITAAQFIKRFVDEGVKWAHLDIAGMVWSEKDGATWAKGATGYGVRVLDRFVADHLEG
ncbi:leucyl aminopeptidase [Sphingomonas sp. Mn802worker]|uniref:leucyl aminopeptidase n=1 Tax=Sphingomonas sp. Mn802worker TaxID=629773 RepID=UPI000476E47D|nr:leucyl aminopeptidase [Sphingomonas sp. Mn802worker]